MLAPLRLAVCGATGRTGSRVAALAERDSRFRLVERVDSSRAKHFESAAAACDVVVDFSVPDASVRFAAACARAGVPVVIGTTGLSDAQKTQLARAASKTPVFLAPNFSRGVTLLLHLAREAARLAPDLDAAIVESHHKGKKDAPSGTALRLAQAVMDGRRSKDAVPASSLRVGDVVGDHTLTFAGPHEVLELTHRAGTRDLFAAGALDAAAWVAKKKPGLYDMFDLMGLR